MALYSQRRGAMRHTVPLLIGDGELLLGCTRDVSIDGLFVVTAAKRALPISSICTISFAWDRDVYSCKARVVRHGVDGIGMALLNPDAETRRALVEATSGAPTT